MGAPNIGVNVNCSTNCYEWCPRSCSMKCCCLEVEESDEEEGSPKRVSFEGNEEVEKKVEQVAQKSIKETSAPRKACIIM